MQISVRVNIRKTISLTNFHNNFIIYFMTSKSFQKRRFLRHNSKRRNLTLIYVHVSSTHAFLLFNVRCTHLWFSLMWNFRFSARTIWHILYIRGRECIRPRSTTTDHLSPTALAHTAPPRHSRPVTANRPPSPPTPPPSPYALRLKSYERQHLRMYVHLQHNVFTTR